MEYTPILFIDRPIEVIFDTPLVLEKNPDVHPNGFIWEGKTYRVLELLSSWNDFKRRGRMAQNMRPTHATVAASRTMLRLNKPLVRDILQIATPAIAGLSSQMVVSVVNTAMVGRLENAEVQLAAMGLGFLGSWAIAAS